MYSVFLVEDESVIREGIKSLIAWEDYGFNFAGEAADGKLAWPLIQKLRPDIVITDIKMPFMDGPALSRLIRRELPKTAIIILGGYDDFSYGKEAISIGVSEYLLKPLSKAQLTEALTQIRVQREEAERQSRYVTQFHAEVQEYLSSSRRGFFDLLISGQMAVSQILDRSEKLGLNLAAQSYNLVLFLLEEDPLHTKYTASSGRCAGGNLPPFPGKRKPAPEISMPPVIMTMIMPQEMTIRPALEPLWCAWWWPNRWRSTALTHTPPWSWAYPSVWPSVWCRASS